VPPVFTVESWPSAPPTERDAVRSRRLVPAALVVALAAVLGACGGTPRHPATSVSTSAAVTGRHLLSDAQIKASLITSHDLGPGFVVDRHKPAATKPALGCLSTAEASISSSKHEVNAARRAEMKFKADSRLGAPRVISFVSTYAEPSEIRARMVRFQTAFGGCTHAEGTDKTGFSSDLDVSLDEKKAGPRVTRQVNLTATGTASKGDISIPIGIRICLIQVDNQALEVEYLTSSGDTVADSERLNRLALGRLLDAIAGRTSDPSPLDLHVTTPEDLLASKTVQS
jgi:hypothetical protein